MLLELSLVGAITDGDTIKVVDDQNQQHKIRLASIDAPERKQPYGLKSKQMLSDLIGKGE
jgi:endonuclease YncB( thermonuclease family)